MTREFNCRDAAFMRRAIELAKNGEGRVSPNPPVGCVLVRDGDIVGEGWHNRLGDLHAEAAALKNAGERARGADCYVTLGPCGTHGRQPPCADALVRAGVARVAVAAEDPNPKNTAGPDILRAAGIAVETGLLRAEAEYVMRGFFKAMRDKRPYLTYKYAMTLDGKTATAAGDSRWISGPESREMVQDMRSRSDAILIGAGTAMADNPLLTVREPVWSRRGGAAEHRQPLRIVVDGALRLRPGSAMLDKKRGAGGAVLVATGVAASRTRAADDLARAGAEILALPDTDGKIDPAALLDELQRRGVYVVLCEGGGGLAAALLAGGHIDEIAAFVAPKLAGGSAAPGALAGAGVGLMRDAVQFVTKEWRRVGDDILIRACPPRTDAEGASVRRRETPK